MVASIIKHALFQDNVGRNFYFFKLKKFITSGLEK